MNKRVMIDTTSKDIDEETQYTNWKSMIDSFDSYEIRFIAAVEPNFRYVNSKTRLLTQENNTIYAPDSFFQGGVWKSCFPFYTRAPFQHVFKVFHEQIRERASSGDSFRLYMVNICIFEHLNLV